MTSVLVYKNKSGTAYCYIVGRRDRLEAALTEIQRLHIDSFIVDGESLESLSKMYWQIADGDRIGFDSVRTGFNV